MRRPCLPAFWLLAIAAFRLLAFWTINIPYCLSKGEFGYPLLGQLLWRTIGLFAHFFLPLDAMYSVYETPIMMGPESGILPNTMLPSL